MHHVKLNNKKDDLLAFKYPENFSKDVVRPHYQAFNEWLSKQSPQLMSQRREEAETIFSDVLLGDDGKSFEF